MRTKENYRGEQFDVTYDKVFRTSEGMGFVLKREEDIDSRMMERVWPIGQTLLMSIHGGIGINLLPYPIHFIGLDNLFNLFEL